VRKFLSILPLVCIVVAVATAQKMPTKPWTEWTDKEAKKVLEDSPWAQTQIDTDTTNMTFNPAQGGGAHDATTLVMHIKFLSAKPIRQALMRQLELQKKAPAPDVVKAFVDRKFEQSIVVAVTYSGPDGRYSGPAIPAFASATIGTLKNNTYLERKDGKRLFLQAYQAPGTDQLGAKFYFTRGEAGVPFISGDAGEFRFHAEIPSDVRQNPNSVNPNSFTGFIKLDMKFKLGLMTYDGTLEY
jgi:hypothetical protein